jgi:hypothetical protein
VNDEAALSRLGGLHHLSERTVLASVVIAIAPALAILFCLGGDLWLDPLKAALREHSLYLGLDFEDGLRLVVPYVTVAAGILLAGRKRMALVFLLFPISIALALGAADLAWRAAFLFYPLIVIGHLIYSVVGWWEVVASILGALSSSLALDRAGLRVQRGRGRHYWPIELLESIELENDSALVARASGGSEVVRVLTDGNDARDTALRIKARFSARKRASRSARARDLDLPRHGDSLGEWRRSLERAWVRGKGPSYRSRAVELAAFVEDDATRGASAEWRAAVAYISIRIGGATARRALERLDADTPPIELALAALAAGTKSVVPCYVWLETTSYLEREQREELEALLSDSAGSRRSAAEGSACPCTAPEVASRPCDAAATRALP